MQTELNKKYLLKLVNDNYVVAICISVGDVFSTFTTSTGKFLFVNNSRAIREASRADMEIYG